MKKGEGIQVCTVEGCDKKHDAKGYCRMHYQRFKNHGSAKDPRLTTSERFWAKVQKGEGCWEWLAGKNSNGYGRIQMGANGEKNVQLAHRIAYTYVNGPIPDGKALDHICGNPGCVKPGHLRPVTTKQNLENLHGAFSTSKSGVRGVSWFARDNKWRGTVTHNRKQYTAGYHDTIQQAEAAVIALRNELFTHNDADRQQQQAA